MPSVTTSIRVRFDTFEPKRTRRPTVSPTFSPQRLRHPFGGGARGEPARFQHDDFLLRRPRLVHQDQRHPRGLAGAGRRHQHRSLARAQRGGQRRQRLIDGQGRIEGPHRAILPVPRCNSGMERMTEVVADIHRLRCHRRAGRPTFRAMPASKSAKSPAAKAAANPAPKKTALPAAIGRAEKGRPRLPGRRLGLHLPRLSRAAAAQPQVGRAAGQCRARLLQHAVEAAARHEAGGQADPSGGHLRQIREDLPHRFLSRLQGAPARMRPPTSSRNSR